MSIMVYPCFLECSKFTDDSFWKSIFEDLAFGICPSGIYISKNFICCNYKHKNFNYKIETNKSNKLLFDEIYNLLHYKFELSSKLELDDYNKQIDQKIKKIYVSQNDWNNIKKKTLKSFLIEDYVLQKKKEFHLDQKNTQKLLSMLSMGFMFKTIESNDIIFCNDKIITIKGIEFDYNLIKSKRIVYEQSNNNTLTQSSFCKECMSEMWNKYLTQIDKKYIDLEQKKNE